MAQCPDGHSVAGSVPQGSVLRPELFNNFINDVGEGIECTPSAFVDVTKLSGMVETPEGWDSIWRDLENLEQGAHVNLMRSNKAKCEVLHLGQGNPQYQHRLGNERIESTSAEDFGVQVGDSWM